MTTDQATDRATDLVGTLYEPGVAGARVQLAASPAYVQLTTADADAEHLDSFLINYCSFGVAMTEPVEGWIQRAGQACVDKGWTPLGEALERHAAQEAGHHEMMIADTRSLVDIWNANESNHGAPLDAVALLGRQVPASVVAYRDLHEQTIDGAEPFGQIAIEYEIELLSVAAGPPLMANIARVCGPDRVEALSFLEEHIEIDVGHTKFNRRQMNQFLGSHPDASPALVEAGRSALEIYAAFITDCASTPLA